jgi:hypothetical protein
MDIVTIVIIVMLIVGALGYLLAARLRARNDARRIQRDKLASTVAGHREMAESHASRLGDLEPQAQHHREAAVEHARRADELEERIERERRHAQFHEERASETEHERERT